MNIYLRVIFNETQTDLLVIYKAAFPFKTSFCNFLIFVSIPQTYAKPAPASSFLVEVIPS